MGRKTLTKRKFLESFLSYKCHHKLSYLQDYLFFFQVKVRIFESMVPLHIRAFTSVQPNFAVYFILKTYFFYFTLLHFQNTHISLSILQIYSTQIILFILFYYYLLIPIYYYYYYFHFPLFFSTLSPDSLFPSLFPSQMPHPTRRHSRSSLPSPPQPSVDSASLSPSPLPLSSTTDHSPPTPNQQPFTSHP